MGPRTVRRREEASPGWSPNPEEVGAPKGGAPKGAPKGGALSGGAPVLHTLPNMHISGKHHKERNFSTDWVKGKGGVNKTWVFPRCFQECRNEATSQETTDFLNAMASPQESPQILQSRVTSDVGAMLACSLARSVPRTGSDILQRMRCEGREI